MCALSFSLLELRHKNQGRSKTENLGAAKFYLVFKNVEQNSKKLFFISFYLLFPEISPSKTPASTNF